MADRWSLDLDRNALSPTMRNNTRSPAALRGNRLFLPSVMDVVDRTTEGTSPSRALATSSVGSNDDIFDAAEVAAVCEPVVQAVAEDVDEADEWDHHGDAG